MKFHTEIPFDSNRFNQIDYNSKVLLLGSCFSENIGDKFAYFKFQCLINPLGILFHPKAIETFITRVINNYHYTEADIFYHNELWHCFDAHSRLSHSSKDVLLKRLNTAVQDTHLFLRDTSHIILTYGTSWVYRFIETDCLVANCHKVPQKKFIKELSSVEQMVECLDAIDALIKSVNPDITVINTVSPVRHLKDGFVENTLSKSHLIAAIHDIIASNKNQNYFPSYELMMDELRDYRFYAEDMLHPNHVAIDHIWSRFKKVWISTEAHSVIEEVDAIQKGLAHKPFHPDSDAHQSFLRQLETRKDQIKSRFSHINF